MEEQIRAKALLGLPLTKREIAKFLLFIANDKDIKALKGVLGAKSINVDNLYYANIKTAHNGN